MPICNSCDGFVSHDFVRVFGNNTDAIGACLSCAPIGEYATADGGDAAHRPLEAAE